MNQAIMNNLAPRIAAAILARRSAIPVVMPIDEWFDLEVNNNEEPMSALPDQYDKADWIFSGPILSGRVSYRVKLVNFGGLFNLGHAKAILRKLDPKLRFLEGQAWSSFRAKFPCYSEGPVAFGGSRWQNRVTKEFYYAFLGHPSDGNFWDPSLDWDGSPIPDSWLWAVALK